LPVFSEFPAITQQEPAQTPTTRQPFDVLINGEKYVITPLFNYEISGLVVSCHFSKMLAEYRCDDLNIMDAGMIWGSNLNPAIYTSIKFYNNGVFLHFKPASRDLWQKFDLNQMSNNHLLCTNPELNEKIKALKRGDLITIKGCLAAYQQQNGWHRGSSTVRTDKGNGACETVWVDEFTVLESGNRHWLLACKISLAAFFSIILLRILRFFIVIYRS
jgi:hypothetical protein